LDNLEIHLSEHAGMLAKLDARDRQREAELKALRRDTTSDIAALDDKVGRLAALLQRHGIDASPATLDQEERVTA
jgi:hypothetical protein